MPVPSNRFDVMDDDLLADIESFMTPSETSTKPSPPSNTPNKKTGGGNAQGSNIGGGVDKYPLPELGKEDAKRAKQIVESLGKSAITGAPLSSTLPSSVSRSLGRDINKIYNKINKNTPPTPFGNKPIVRPKSGNELGCRLDINDLLKALGVGGSGNGLLGLLALLNRLVCAGINNGVSTLLNNIQTDNETAGKFAAEALRVAANGGGLEVVKDIATTNAVDYVKKHIDNPSSFVIESLKHSDPSQMYNRSEEYDILDSSLTKIDPKWSTNDTDFSSFSGLSVKSRENYDILATAKLQSTPVNVKPPSKNKPPKVTTPTVAKRKIGVRNTSTSLEDFMKSTMKKLLSA